MIKVQKTTYLHLPKNDDELCNMNMVGDVSGATVGSKKMSLLQDHKNVTEIVVAELWRM